MLPEQPRNLERKYLIQNTGIQFLDVDVDLSDQSNYDRHERNYFNSEGDLITKKNQRLQSGYSDSGDDYNETKKTYLDSPAPNLKNCALEDTLTIFENTWIPLPYFMSKDKVHHFKVAPLNWCRAYLKRIDDSRKYRMVLAFDTQTVDVNDVDKISLKDYLLNEQDISGGNVYELCSSLADVRRYILDNQFVERWICELWKEFARKNEFSNAKYNNGLTDKVYVMNYLQLIFTLLDRKIVTLPSLRIKVFEKGSEAFSPPVKVNLALDIGNSRICGLMYESNGNDIEVGKNTYRVEIRDFTNPVEIYNEPFSSNVEFAYPSFSPYIEELPDKMFNWCSMVRIGNEAVHLSWTLEGNEGDTGMSSPKRYLWDTDPFISGWKVNKSALYNHDERALIYPVASNVTRSGEVIELDDLEAVEAVSAKYSRSSMMTFLICELIAQVESQINSIGERTKHSNEDNPRYLDHIVLTVPTAMPIQEVVIFEKRVNQAITLFWNSMNWSQKVEDPDAQDSFRIEEWPPKPKIVIRYDEAICSQIVYLYNELQSKFAGHFSHFLKIIARNKSSENSKVTIATVDFGGGTTDFVINDFEITNHINDTFRPVQKFRESFKIAGDDILLEFVRKYVITSIKSYCINELGLSESFVEDYLYEKIGYHSRVKTIQAKTLKKHLTMQIFYPVAVAIITTYQNYTTDRFRDINGMEFGKIIESLSLGEKHIVTQNVLDYFNLEIQNETGNENFSILQIPLKVDFFEIHTNFVTCKTYDICTHAISYIAEIINRFDCDIVLLSGRPSTLPGIESCFRNKLMLPGERIIQLSNLRMGSWYAYASGGKIEDPKTAVAVGALMLHLCLTGKVENFYIKLGENVKLKSSIHYIGKLDSNGTTISDNDIYYRDVNLDDPDYKLTGTFQVPGRVTIGYRSLNIERWPANPLYKLILSDELAQRLNEVDNGYLELSLERIENEKAEGRKDRFMRDELQLKSQAKSGNKNLDVDTDSSGKNVFLKLCTMPFSADGDANYWLDSGCVKDD